MLFMILIKLIKYYKRESKNIYFEKTKVFY